MQGCDRIYAMSPVGCLRHCRWSDAPELSSPIDGLIGAKYWATNALEVLYVVIDYTRVDGREEARANLWVMSTARVFECASRASARGNTVLIVSTSNSTHAACNAE